MNLKIIGSVSYTEKKKLLGDICLMYRRLVKSTNIIEDIITKLDRNVIPRKSLFNERSISIFKTILELLPEEEREVIERDFIRVESNAYWYEDRYSKTRYYKIKNNAMNNFLYLFYK